MATQKTRLYPEPEVPAPRAGQRYADLMRLMDITAKMTKAGWKLDRGQLEVHRALAEKRAVKYRDLFLSLTGLPRSDLGKTEGGGTKAVKDWFWKTCNAPAVFFDKITKQPQFNTETLIEYSTTYRKERFGPAAAALYGMRKNRKLLEFCATYEAMSRADGRIHFEFIPSGTQTGRWTSSTKLRAVLPDGTRHTYKANGQQIPNKTPKFNFGAGDEVLVDSLRDVFIADPGCVLLKCDWEQLELRELAYMTGAKLMLKYIDEGRDIHMMNAIGLFTEMGIPPNAKKVKKPSNDMEALANKAREAVKSAFGICYQMYDDKPAEEGKTRYPTLHKAWKKNFPSVTESQTNTYVRRFIKMYPEIVDWQQGTKRKIGDLGYQELSVNGRRLYYPDTMRGYHQALNFPMQGTGAALADRALLEIDPKLDWVRQQVRLQCHDELVIQAPLNSMGEVKGWIEEGMCRPALIGETMASIPAKADPGWNYGNNIDYADFCFDTFGSPED